MSYVLNSNGKFQWRQQPQTGAGAGGLIDVGALYNEYNKAYAAWQNANQTPEDKADNPFDFSGYNNRITLALSQNKQIQDKIDSDNALALAKETKAMQQAAAQQARADKIKDDLKKEEDRLREEARKRQAGEQAATYLETTAGTRSKENEKRINELYGGLKASQKTMLDEILANMETDFQNAATAVGAEGERFQKDFRAGTSYQGVPISQLSVESNPLLASLQQQGAGTEEVDAATELSRQTSKATSDLEKWAIAQLNTQQQNYDSATLNAGRAAMAASLQGLAQRKPQVAADFQKSYQTNISDLETKESEARSTSQKEIDALLDEAAKIRANTVVEVGTTPVVGSAASRKEQVALAPTQYANFGQAVKALNPNFNPKTAGKTAVDAFPALAKAFGKGKK
jgi:hypothetical protein